MASAILTETYIGKTYKEYQREFVEHFPYGKQIGKILDIQNKQKRHGAPKHTFGTGIRQIWKYGSKF